MQSHTALARADVQTRPLMAALGGAAPCSWQQRLVPAPGPDPQPWPSAGAWALCRGACRCLDSRSAALGGVWQAACATGLWGVVGWMPPGRRPALALPSGKGWGRPDLGHGKSHWQQLENVLVKTIRKRASVWIRSTGGSNGRLFGCFPFLRYQTQHVQLRCRNPSHPAETCLLKSLKKESRIASCSQSLSAACCSTTPEASAAWYLVTWRSPCLFKLQRTSIKKKLVCDVSLMRTQKPCKSLFSGAGVQYTK